MHHSHHRLVPTKCCITPDSQPSNNEPKETDIIFPPLPENLLETAHAAADAAGKVLRDFFRKPIPVDYKTDASPVTQADRLAEAVIRNTITAAFPTHVIIGEEEGSDGLNPEQSQYGWVIDPLDGTRAFVCGRPTFASLIAVLYQGIPIIGVIDQPIARERWVGVRGQNTLLNGVPISVQPRTPLKSCILQATTPEMFVGLDAVKFRRVTSHARNTVYGGDCYAYALLASGFCDLVVEADLKVWDFLALVPVVEGAGGIMADWAGLPLRLGSDGRVIASASPDVFAEVIQILDVAEEMRLKPGVTQVSNNPALIENDLPDDPGPGHVESMTGYGRHVFEHHGFVVTAQVRSVNSRFCEVQIRGAGVLAAFESKLVNLVKKLAVRGKITVGLDIDVQDNSKQKKLGVIVDEQAIREVSSLLSKVSEVAGVSSPTVSDVLQFSEVLIRQGNGIVSTELFPVAKEAIRLATENMRACRRQEGVILELDMMKRTRKISHILDDIEQRADDRVVAEKARLNRTLDAVVDREVSAPRIETEVTLFADRVDFTEEVVRLRSHVMVFELTFIGADEPIGQRLTFLLQEMNREANTLASKASDAAVSHLAVLIKEEIEKIREQCGNIR